ncbi:hypothetical protein EMPS_08547 [Entomortierella parvispora]|uniref:F-box domain-containing protein n=1 Tax=Entomortierella parvispora TaxID=205924 RepID=A0A9P3HGW4_9FUNG|nr:hypothetical protein EMPS_08547 [Entomortierella parvispora]
MDVPESANAPSMTSLRKHGHRIRHLALRKKDSYDITEQDLQPTEDDYSDLDYIPTGLRWTNDFLRDYPKIERLELHEIPFLPALTVHNLGLKELSLIQTAVGTGDIAYILKHCKELESLTIADSMLTRAHDGWPKNTPKLFPNIKALDFRRIIGPSLGFLLEWVARCPGLEELRIEPGSIHKEYTDTDYTILEQCPKLSRLEIRKLQLVDGELATILDNCSQLTHLTLRGERLNEKEYRALRRHFPTLQVLNFFGTVEMRSWMCGHIVYMCPNLVELTTSDLKLDEFLTLTPPKITRVRDTPSKTPAKKRLTMAESALAENNPLLPTDPTKKNMDLVEIQLHVGKFLSASSLAACVQVSQTWHAIFLPLLYSVISFQNEKTDIPHDPALPTKAHIQRHGHHIRDLLLRLPSRYTQELLSTSKSLKKLRIVQRRERRHESDSEVMQLVHNNPRIQKLELVAFRGSELCCKVAQDVQICSRLTELRFFRMVEMDVLVVAQLLQSCEQLTTFGLSHCKLSFVGGTDRVLWPKLLSPLKTLELTECNGAGLALFFDWMIHSHSGVFERLSRLVICKLGLEDGVLTTLLGRCSTDLAVLILKYETFSWTEFVTLRRLSGTLKILHLSLDCKIWLYQQIFCSFTGLVEIWRSILFVDSVCASEPEHPLPNSGTRTVAGPMEKEEDELGMIQEPWACIGVRRLTLHIRWSLSDLRNSEMVNRLTKLKGLEEMELTANYSQSDRKRWEDNKGVYEKQKFLACGSPQTRDLRRSSWKTGTFKRSDMAYYPALKWMVETWPRLKVFKYTDVDAAESK